MERIYKSILQEQFASHQQMAIVSGPRQVGKTTLAQTLAGDDESRYLNWDDATDRQLILGDSATLATQLGLDRAHDALPVVIFDEIHKYARWKQFLKGFYDHNKKRCRVIVTGSARMTVFKKGGDSLMGRYFEYRLHPLSVSEICRKGVPRESEIAAQPQAIGDDDYQALVQFGGYPEPWLKRDKRFFTRWAALREQQLLREDIRDLTQVQVLGQMETLAQLLRAQAGGQTSYSNLANKVRVSVDTVQRWLGILESLYYCYAIRPWSKNVTRSLLKEPRYYLWDWTQCQDEGARSENFIASHLLKAVQFWTDTGLGKYDLHYLRDKEKREVDFLVSRNNKPWFLVEAKHSENEGLSPQLAYFQQQVKAAHAFQVAVDGKAVKKNLFEYTEPVIVPARSFLSQLV